MIMSLALLPRAPITRYAPTHHNVQVSNGPVRALVANSLAANVLVGVIAVSRRAHGSGEIPLEAVLEAVGIACG